MGKGALHDSSLRRAKKTRALLHREEQVHREGSWRDARRKGYFLPSPTTFSDSSGLLTVCTNFKTTNIRVQRKSFLQLAIRASWSWHLLAQTSFQLAPKTFWLAELISQFFGYLNSSKNITCPSHKLKTECTRPIAKSTSPGYRTLLSLQTEYTLKPWILNQFGLSQRAGGYMGISLSFHEHNHPSSFILSW